MGTLVAAENIMPIVVQLGVGAIFLWLYVSERNRNCEMQDKLVSAYGENSKVLEKTTIVIADLTHTIENNTKAIEELKQMQRERASVRKN